MAAELKRDGLKKIVKTLRSYGRKLLDDLSIEEVLWIPEGTKARSIHSYFRHIINAELFWLKQIGYEDTPEYLSREQHIEELMKNYEEVGTFISQEIEKSSEENLIPRIPDEGATLSWVIWRTSFHAIHHFAQIAYIRYALEKPPTSKEGSWGQTMDTLILLKQNF